MIEARYSGKCSGCGEEIVEGDPIGRVDGEWVCAACVDDAGGEDLREEAEDDYGSDQAG